VAAISAVLGAAFKPDSDDVRDSPAIGIASRIAGLGATVTITDPRALDNVQRARPDLKVAPDAIGAAQGADVVLLLTEWPEYVNLDPNALGAVVRRRAIIDGRNALDPLRWRVAGWAYTGIGR
jgi:UDPglucose 6-dehydrogenase